MGCCFVAHGVYIYCFLVFVFSESMLFATVFWVLLHIILSSYYMLYESILIPEPCELAYGAALLLSNAGVSIGTVYVSRDSTGVLYWSVISSLVYSLLFLVLQVGEFQVLVGVGIVGVSSGTGYSVDIVPVDTTSVDIYF